MPTIKESGAIAVHGICFDCDWKIEGGATAMQATKHHETTGHHIRVEQSIWWERKCKPGTKPTAPLNTTRKKAPKRKK